MHTYIQNKNTKYILCTPITFFVMKKRQESCSLLIHVALQDGLANCEMIVCLVFFSFGLLVPGLWRNSVVVFASTHEATRMYFWFVYCYEHTCICALSHNKTQFERRKGRSAGPVAASRAARAGGRAAGPGRGE